MAVEEQSDTVADTEVCMRQRCHWILLKKCLVLSSDFASLYFLRLDAVKFLEKLF